MNAHMRVHALTRRLPMLSRSQQQERSRRVSHTDDTRNAKRPFAGIVRPYLITASVAAATIDAAAAVAVLGFDVPESLFETAAFRVLGVGLVALVVLATRGAASVAFRTALRERHAVRSPQADPPVRVSSACPARGLVLLHLAFTGTRYASAEHAER
jgi:hypothetical protein